MDVDLTPNEGYASFFRSSFPLVESVARRITGDRSTAEDVAAEAFTRAYLHWARLADDSRRVGWVVRVGANLAIDAVRRGPPPARSADPASSNDDGVVLRLALVAALRRLSKRERETITLRYLADLSEAEVAAALGVSAGSVKTYVHRALAHLRPLLAAGTEHEVEGRLAIDTE